MRSTCNEHVWRESQFFQLRPCLPPPFLIPRQLGHDMGGVQSVWGEENVLENAPSRKILDPSKRASGLLSCGFCTGKTEQQHPRRVETHRTRGGPKPLFGSGVICEVFLLFFKPPLLFFYPPMMSSETQEPRKGFFLKGVFARIYVSLGCSALSAKCTAGPNILGYFCFHGRDARLCKRKPLLKPPFLGFRVPQKSAAKGVRSLFFCFFRSLFGHFF